MKAVSPNGSEVPEGIILGGSPAGPGNGKEDEIREREEGDGIGVSGGIHVRP